MTKIKNYNEIKSYKEFDDELNRLYKIRDKKIKELDILNVRMQEFAYLVVKNLSENGIFRNKLR